MPGVDRPAPRRIGRRELQTYVAQGLLTVDEASPSEADLRRVRRIRRLRRDLGLSYPAIEIVLRLVDRLEAAERRDGSDPHTTVRITVVGR
ncbi:MAG TPA: chaperone modulator CbpM [Candidatus Dormibacteraeota bacterium]|jgi:DNA-binding transcriptional MerR regulator|nr:chaperone modulator CbpM [Candidatus Dormibacteraeota bacterium]